MDDENYTEMEGLLKEFESGISKKLQRYFVLKVGALNCFFVTYNPWQEKILKTGLHLNLLYSPPPPVVMGQELCDRLVGGVRVPSRPLAHHGQL